LRRGEVLDTYATVEICAYFIIDNKNVWAHFLTGKCFKIEFNSLSYYVLEIFAGK